MKDWKLKERPHGFVVVNGAGAPVSPGFGTRLAALAWVERRAQAVPPKWRQCLGCGRDFHSEGAHDRMCPNCGAGGYAGPSRARSA